MGAFCTTPPEVDDTTHLKGMIAPKPKGIGLHGYKSVDESDSARNILNLTPDVLT